MKKSLFSFVLAAFVVFVLNTAVHAAVVVSYTTTATPTVSTDDLAAGLTSYYQFRLGNWDAAELTNGTVGTSDWNCTPKNERNDFAYYLIDLGSSQTIGTVNSYSKGGASLNEYRAWQKFSLYGGGADASIGQVDTGWTLIASVDSTVGDVPDLNVYGVSSITGINADYQKLQWVCEELDQTYQMHSTMQEFDVLPVPEPATMGMLAMGGLALLRRRHRS